MFVSGHNEEEVVLNVAEAEEVSGNLIKYSSN